MFNHQPEWVLALRAELRDLHRQQRDLKDGQVLLAAEQARARTERLHFETQMTSQVNERLQRMERAMAQFLDEHQSTVAFQQHLVREQGGAKPRVDVLTSLAASALAPEAYFQPVHVVHAETFPTGAHPEARSLPPDPLRPCTSVS